MRRYERASTAVNPTALWRTGENVLGDSVAVTAMLDRWRTKMEIPEP